MFTFIGLMSVPRSATRQLALMEEPVFRTISVNAHLDGVVVHVPKLFAPILASTDFAFYPTNASAILAGPEPHATLLSANLSVPLAITRPIAPVVIPASQGTYATFVYIVQALSVEGML